MPKIGAHMSIAGGLPLAVDRAVAHGCETLQIFTKSSNQWRARDVSPEERAEFRRKVDESGITPVVAHASCQLYLPRSVSYTYRKGSRSVSYTYRKQLTTRQLYLPFRNARRGFVHRHSGSAGDGLTFVGGFHL